MTSGIYLVQQSNLNEEKPRSVSKKHSIIQFKFEKGLISKKKGKECVIICVDSTYGERYKIITIM